MGSCVQAIHFTGTLLLLVLTLCDLTLSFHDCSIIKTTDLESYSGLIASTFIKSNSTNNSSIQLLQYNVVCLAQGAHRDTWRSVSLVANYTFNQTNVISQFQFECVDSTWTSTVNGSDVYTRTDVPDSTLDTVLRTDCLMCIDPRQAPLANNSQHCLECDESCSQGLRRCTSQDTCCSYFVDNKCTLSCPDNTISTGNSTCCPQGFQGDHCLQDIDECVSNNTLCGNGGVCNNTPGGFTCLCLDGFTGNRCETGVNECESNPCLNGAECVNITGKYHCICPFGYNGSNCGECQEGYSLVPSSGKCESTSTLSGGAIAGIVIAILLVLILGAIIVALILVALSIRKKKNFSKHFRESHIGADYESSQHVMKNPVLQGADTVEFADSGISIESDEHLAVNTAALEFEENSQDS